MANPEPLHPPASLSAHSRAQSTPLAPSDTGRAARIGLWVLGLGLGGFLVWAAVAPLDEGVPSQGVVAIDTKRKAVQHLSGGIVKQVFVREGDVVQMGQTLISLDDAVAKANYEAVRQRYLGLRAVQGRLLAEQSGAASIVFHPDLQAAAQDPLISQQMKNQEQLMLSRRAALRADLQGIEEGIQGQNALMQAYAGMLTSRRGQRALLEDELRHTRELVKEGYSPRNRQLELERLVAESNLSITELLGNTSRAQRGIGEMRQKMLARQQEYRKEVETTLADVTRDVQSDTEKYTALKADLDRMDIRAPASGQIVGLAVQSVGAVVQAGQHLMSIVPPDEPLVLEARIAPHLIDKVRPGLEADVRFTAFAHSPQLVVQGELASVSADLLTDTQSGVSYYLARVKVTPGGMKTLGERHLQPGMPAEVVIKTGERTMLTYLLAPLLKRMSGSLKEE